MRAAKGSRRASEHRLTPEDILAPHDPSVVALAQRLRQVVKRVMPEAEERAYPVWKGIGFVHPEAGYVCGVFPSKDHVALAFEFGVLLDDPEGLLRPGRTSSKKVRYVEIRKPTDIRIPALQRLLRNAIALRSCRGRADKE